MNDAEMLPAGQATSSIDLSDAEQSAVSEPSAGTLLRQAREAAGMHIAALAVSLKVPVKKLEALEQDRFDLLPDVVFVRALASSVCRSLKLDVAPILERLPQTGAPKLIVQRASINAPFRSPGESPRPAIWTQVSRPAVLAGLVLLLGALVLIFFPAVKQDAADAQNVGDMQSGGMEAVKPLPAAVTMAGGGVLDSTQPVFPAGQINEPSSGGTAGVVAGLPSGTVMPGAAALSGSAPPVVMPTGPASTPAASAVPVPSASQAAPSGIVTFHAKGESWVEVTDAKGTVVLRRTLTAGEVVGASGTLPLAAVVGKADATQVQVRGRAFDLGAVARDNVARFEVK